MPKIDISVPILIRKLFICIRNPKIVKFFLRSKFFKFLGNILNLFPTYSIKSGSHPIVPIMLGDAKISKLIADEERYSLDAGILNANYLYANFKRK